MTVTAHYCGFEVDACNGNGMCESNSYIKAFVDVRIPEREFEIPPFSFKSANSGVKETEQLLHRARKLCVCGQDDEQSPFLLSSMTCHDIARASKTQMYRKLLIYTMMMTAMAREDVRR